MAEKLSEALAALREGAGLTQEQLEARSGVAVRTIRRLETGRSTNCRTDTLRRLAKGLDAGPEGFRRLTAALDGSEPEAGEVAGVPEPRVPEQRRPPGWALARQPLAEAAGELAAEVLRRLRQEEGQRRVHDPYALPVRWLPAAVELTDRLENVSRLAPGESAALELDLDGDLRSVAAIYRRIASGRLVVLGRGGSGKSILAIRFVLDLLEGGDGPERVPVVFSLGSWDPTAVGLLDWLVEVLLRDHPNLARRLPGGRTLAAELVRSDLVLPVLDGFDELAEGLRPEALRALNTTTLPLVVTSRRAEYAEAVEAARAPLVWAAGIELADLTLADLDGYLPRTVRPVSRPPVWDGVLAELHTGSEAGGQLASALSTPLFVGLARTMYSEDPERDPGELLDTERFPDAHAIEEHLLAGFVPTVYKARPPDRESGPQREWDVPRAQHWLGYLAHHLVRLDRERQDLAWWQLGDSVRRSTQVLTTVLVATVCLMVPDWLLAGVFVPYGPGESLLEGALMGPIAGLAFGLVHAVLALFGSEEFEPARVRLRLPRPGGGLDRRALRQFMSRSGAVLLGGSVMGIGAAWALSLERVVSWGVSVSTPGFLEATLINMLVFGLIFGLSTAVVFGLLTVFESPLDITAAASPVDLLAANRATVSRQLLVLAPSLALTIAATGRLVVVLLQPLLGPMSWTLVNGLVIGAIGGIGGSLAYTFCFTAWGRWVVLVRLFLPLTGRLPWRTVEFLDDAYRRGVLRRTGAVYQFRHLRLQHHLGNAYRAGRSNFAPVRLEP
ncbi:helix-turn-helix domain-containing protein [Kitasatospora sp. NPDC002227]|uniref:helix-turn-helix domain-containing protein n=1 Tax=Kitasatospora sp. NPDC002227 TaxID=3154773 RepID=UPI00331E256E